MSYQPARGDAVEAWLKRKRDEYTDDGWWALDAALDEYRLRSDTGASLEVPLENL